MSEPADKPPLLPSQMSSVDPRQALRRLFLTLFLRGRSSRGLNQKGAPKSIAQKLLFTLVFYGLFGCTALSMIRQHVFAVAVYLHAMTFTFLGMFVATSAGEILFNKEEADILLHRPIEPRVLLWAKIRVLVEVALWVAACLNLAGLVAGIFVPDGSWLFPVVHIASIILETFFCTGSVILLYQLCLRWLGRERLDGVMTTVQVLGTILIIVSSQLLPRVIIQFGFSLTASQSPGGLVCFPRPGLPASTMPLPEAARLSPGFMHRLPL
jgi:ABC-2 type transport system permease protein